MVQGVCAPLRSSPVEAPTIESQLQVLGKGKGPGFQRDRHHGGYLGCKGSRVTKVISLTRYREGGSNGMEIKKKARQKGGSCNEKDC